MYDLNEINERHGHYSSPYQDTESELTPDSIKNNNTYQKPEIAPQMAANEPTGVFKEDEKREYCIVCENCGWEGPANSLLGNNLEDNCPQCHSNKIEWEDKEDMSGDFDIHVPLPILSVKKVAHMEETLTNTQIREQLYKLLPLFLKQNCQYNDGERVFVERLYVALQPVNPEFEKYNEEHPGHGLPNQKQINQNEK